VEEVEMAGLKTSWPCEECGHMVGVVALGPIDLQEMAKSWAEDKLVFMCNVCYDAEHQGSEK
jgi:hypothetical protein